jgi:predicted adenine nucleotide alpha hydrolase (AANH) superfamily ATPase
VLRAAGYDPSGLFFNPNIHPFAEYAKRLEAMRDYAALSVMGLEVAEGYPVEIYFRSVSFHENDRCRHCYRIRLEETARRASGGGFEAFSTTMLYSKYQQHELIKEIGEAIAGETGIRFVYMDFREGWQEGIDISKALSIYRQKYCGCIYSERERFIKKKYPR